MITTAVSLFSGIGGFELALERQGIITEASVEIDHPCQDLLARHFSHDIFTDVKGVKGADLLYSGFTPETGILTAGWPCQGNSVAGLRNGMADPRSGLWREVVRLLAETRPRYFVGENVPGLLTVRNGRDFLRVIESLDELGYGVAWRVLDAQYFGVPQRRRRVFIVGCLGDGAGPAEILLEPGSVQGDSAESGEAEAFAASTTAVSTLQGGGRRGYRVDAEGAAGGHVIPVAMRGREGGAQIEYGEPGDPAYTVRTPAGGSSYPMVAHTLTSGVAASPGVNPPGRRNEDDYNLIVGTLDAHDGPRGHGGANVQSAYAGHYLPHDVGVRRLTPRECERLQGFPDDWTAGQSDSARYRQLGNAVAVPVAEWVTRRIVAFNSTSSPQGLQRGLSETKPRSNLTRA